MTADIREARDVLFKSTFCVRSVDTDSDGVMHFSNFLRYFEACEDEFYRSLGITRVRMREKYNIMLPRTASYCEYKATCKLGEMIEVTLNVHELAEKTVTNNFRIVRKRDSKLAAEGYLRSKAVGSNWEAVRIPEEIARIIRERAVRHKHKRERYVRATSMSVS